MDLKQIIENLVEERLEKEYFIVEVLIGGNKNNPKINISLDGDKGISIDYCAEISRKVGHAIEEGNIIDTAYLLEVSSSGVGEPLKLHRQYVKNIGRNIKVELEDGKSLTGKLENVTDIHLYILPEKKKKEKAEPVVQEISIDKIKKTQVLVSF